MRSSFGSDGIQLALSQAPYNTVLADGYACIGKPPQSALPARPP